MTNEKRLSLLEGVRELLSNPEFKGSVQDALATCWNDQEGKTREEVLEAIDRAINAVRYRLEKGNQEARGEE